ncbi:MAG: glycoside hydrolase family 43 protein [Planctomycetota bacterium]
MTAHLVAPRTPDSPLPTGMSRSTPAHLNGELWRDIHGRPIQAHGGGLLRFDEHWYWYGEDKSGRSSLAVTGSGQTVERVDLVGVAVYRSADLKSWERLGIALSPRHDDLGGDLHVSQFMERPKVVYHPSGTFVMWVHIDRPDYQLAATGVAIADRPEGPFTYLGSVRPGGLDSRDQTVFLDEDGAAYHVCSTDRNATTLVTRLTNDYRGLTGESAKVFVDRHMEAQAIARVNGRYWFLASGCTGWHPNEARSAVAESIWGPWHELGNPCRAGSRAELTWGMQSAFMQRLDGDRVLVMFDRWRPRDLKRSGYGWFTASPRGERFEIDWRPEWTA